jgi:hypothetical protein
MLPEVLHVVALDTGAMTGVSVITWTRDHDIVHSANEFPWIDAVRYAARWSEECDMFMCCERYDQAPGKRILTPQPEALMAIGALTYLATQCNATLRQQPRAEAKRVVTDSVLRKLGWYKKTKDGHANDASRQAGFFLHQNFPALWLELTDPV